MSNRTLLIAASIVTALAAGPAVAQRPDSTLVGEWSGVARISVDWTLQREVAVRVVIHDDGAVTGQIGDAQLRNGRIRTNRSRILRAMGYGSDWVIEAHLSGPIVRPEAVERELIRVPLNRKGDTLEGELATSGSYEAMRDDMILTANGLVLRRVGGVPAPTAR